MDFLNYDLMIQKALRRVVRESLKEVSKNGLYGDHHFYLTFRTNQKGVKIPKRLYQKHPKEITVVLQHQFWDLKVEKDYFEVNLNFEEVPEKITVPFSALISFMDPSVRFGLQFNSELENFEAKPNIRNDKVNEKVDDSGKIIKLDSFRKK